MAKAEQSLREMIKAAPHGRDWLHALEQSLGKLGQLDVLEKLSARTADGLELAPIYPLRGNNSSLSTISKPEAGWKTLTRIDHPDPKAANSQLLHDLEHGADGAVLVMKGAETAYGFGVDLSDQSALEALFDGIFVDATNLQIEGFRATHFAWWEELCRKRSYDQSSLNIRFNDTDINEAIGNAGKFVADGSKWHNKGATAAQELALTLAEVVSLLRDLNATGFKSASAFDRLSVSLSSDADQFETLAKFRSMRLLWDRLVLAMSAERSSLTIHANTSWRMLGRREPWTNVLRATMATFSAGLGGADSICVLPHTQALGLPDGFTRRVARNVGLILQEESHLGKMFDPAAGAGVFDHLTQSLAETAWGIFQSVEAEGGFTDAIGHGLVQRIISSSRQERLDSIATRKIVSLGNSHFAQLDAPEVATLMERPLETEIDVHRLDDLRDGILFEQLAKRAQTISADNKSAVLLLCLGNRKSWKARSDFASDLFSAGGLATDIREVDADLTLSNVETSKTPIICLCGSDADYKTNAHDLIEKLQHIGARYVLLAGQSDISGLNDKIFEGCNVGIALHKILQVLEGLQNELS